MSTELETKLSEYDFIAVVDASGSMGEPNKAGATVSRWAYMQETLMSFARDIAKIDSDGIGLVVFGGSNIQKWDGVGPDQVKAVFEDRQPRGGTPLAEALTAAFGLAGKSAKKDFIIVFTDGVPDDQEAAAKVLRDQANKQETDDACTVLFVQVGDNAEASTYLRRLDDNLKGAKFDIVDARTIEEAEKFKTTAELVYAAIND